MPDDQRWPRTEPTHGSRAKVARYLLDTSHPGGGPNARFFVGHGYSPDRPDELAAALQDHVRSHASHEREETLVGVKYAVDGPLQCPDATSGVVRTVWVIQPPATHQRLVTAYPVPPARPRLAE